MGESAIFWDDLAEDLADPRFQREYVAGSIRIATIDRIINELDTARETAGQSKADLARAINAEPATVRRLFSAGHANPRLGTHAEVAAALGMRVALQPLDVEDRHQVTDLLHGMADDARAVAHHVGDVRRQAGAEQRASV